MSKVNDRLIINPMSLNEKELEKYLNDIVNDSKLFESPDTALVTKNTFNIISDKLTAINRTFNKEDFISLDKIKLDCSKFRINFLTLKILVDISINVTSSGITIRKNSENLLDVTTMHIAGLVKVDRVYALINIPKFEKDPTFSKYEGKQRDEYARKEKKEGKTWKSKFCGIFNSHPHVELSGRKESFVDLVRNKDGEPSGLIIEQCYLSRKELTLDFIKWMSIPHIQELTVGRNMLHFTEDDKQEVYDKVHKANYEKIKNNIEKFYKLETNYE